MHASTWAIHLPLFLAALVIIGGISRSISSLASSEESRPRPSPDRHRLQRASKRFFLFPKLQCALALRRNGFDLENFDKYTTFFRDDSVMQLAQAGIYQGPSDIEEYVKFVYYGYSPYLVNNGTRHDYGRGENRNKILGYNRDTGQCEYLVLFYSFVALNASTTNPDVPRFNYVTMVKLFLDVDQNYIAKANVYFPADFLRVFFDVALNSTNTRRFVCDDVMKGPCAAILNSTSSSDECVETLASLPSTQGALHYSNGNTSGCRVLHGAFARTNPTLHCAHMSFLPLADPTGRIKCQGDSTQVAPTDLFTESDFAIFRRFTKRQNLDPDIGHNLDM